MKFIEEVEHYNVIKNLQNGIHVYMFNPDNLYVDDLMTVKMPFSELLDCVDDTNVVFFRVYGDD